MFSLVVLVNSMKSSNKLSQMISNNGKDNIKINQLIHTNIVWASFKSNEDFIGATKHAGTMLS